MYESEAGDQVGHLVNLVAERQVQPVYCPRSPWSAGAPDLVVYPDCQSLHHLSRLPLTVRATSAEAVPVP